MLANLPLLVNLDAGKPCGRGFIDTPDTCHIGRGKSRVKIQDGRVYQKGSSGRYRLNQVSRSPGQARGNTALALAAQRKGGTLTAAERTAALRASNAYLSKKTVKDLGQARGMSAAQRRELANRVRKSKGLSPIDRATNDLNSISLRKYQRLASGVEGATYLDKKNGIVIKELHAGKFKDKNSEIAQMRATRADEIKISRAAHRLGVGPAIYGTTKTRTSMQYLDGYQTVGSATQRMLLGKPNEPEKMLRGAMTAVNKLHRGGIAHEDLHSGNIMINSNDDVKIIDYGFAKKSHKSALKESLKFFEFGLLVDGSAKRKALLSPYNDQLKAVGQEYISQYGRPTQKNITEDVAEQRSKELWRKAFARFDRSDSGNSEWLENASRHVKKQQAEARKEDRKRQKQKAEIDARRAEINAALDKVESEMNNSDMPSLSLLEDLF